MRGQTRSDYPETLPAAWYHDAAVFQRERQAIFARNWSLIGRLEKLARPGDYVAGEVAGYPVFVLRAREGGLKGFHNVCRHRAGPMVRDELKIAAYENGAFVGFDVCYQAPEGRGTSRGFWVYKFPALLMHFSETSFNLEQIVPLGPRRILLKRWFWFTESAGEAAVILFARDFHGAERRQVFRDKLSIQKPVAAVAQSGD